MHNAKLLYLTATLACSATVAQSFTLPGLYYPAALSSDLRSRPVQIKFQNTRLVLYRNATTSAVVAHSDICPHQGASLSKTGCVTAKGHLMCGYHGFLFCGGRYVGMAGDMTAGAKERGGFQMPLWEAVETQGLVFLKAPGYVRQPLHSGCDAVPEATDPAFRRVAGVRVIPQHHQVVTENVLDMLHVSYVHRAFGNRASPLPTSVKYEPIGQFSGRSTFLYRPRPGSLASLLGPPFPEVVVENEFYLPGTTVTRVRTNNEFVKTVVTRALPEGDGSTKLFWEVHRNFWKDPMGIGDAVMAYLMERTLDEDAGILAHVDAKHREGPIRTKYDVTIKKYRQAIENWTAMMTNTFLI